MNAHWGEWVWTRLDSRVVGMAVDSIMLEATPRHPRESGDP
ncbi:MAG: hypothetical protein ACPGF7_09320 [Pontibacterium sp.]